MGEIAVPAINTSDINIIIAVNESVTALKPLRHRHLSITRCEAAVPRMLRLYWATNNMCLRGHQVQQVGAQTVCTIANPAPRGQLNEQGKSILVSRDGFGCPIPNQPTHSPGLNLVATHGIPPASRDGVHLPYRDRHRVIPELSYSGRATAYQ